MKQTLKLIGIPPYSGTYTIDGDHFTTGDFHTIKRISGYTAMEISDAGGRGDMDVVVALAVVALKHAGHPVVDEDALWNALPTAFELETEEEPIVASPPPPASGSVPSDSPPPSTEAGKPDSATPSESTPASTGVPDSATGATSAPIRSVS